MAGYLLHLMIKKSRRDRMTNGARTTNFSVDMVLYQGFKALEVIGLLKVFDCANECLQQRRLAGGYQVSIASSTIGMVSSDTIMSLQATKKLDALAIPDMAIIVGGDDMESALVTSPEIALWVRAVAPKIKRLLALHSGVFFWPKVAH
jgi:transcriptional regulator GlxA family with amidase domain